MNNVNVSARGVYFKSQHGKWIESHSGTPGVELAVGNTRVFIDHREISLLTRSIDRLGTSGENSVTVRAVFIDE